VCCKLGNLSDANVLLRKYRDDLFFCMYVETVAEESWKKENFGDDYLGIVSWLKNELENLQFSSVLKQIGNLPILKDAPKKVSSGTTVWVKQIGNLPILKDAVKRYNLQSMFNKIGKTLNNYVHANGIVFYNKLYNRYKDKEFEAESTNLVENLNYITITFVFLRALYTPISIMSTDHIDYLELGESPPEDSQYWVEPFITDFFLKHKDILDEDCMNYIKNVTDMQLLG